MVVSSSRWCSCVCVSGHDKRGIEVRWFRERERQCIEERVESEREKEKGSRGRGVREKREECWGAATWQPVTIWKSREKLIVPNTF